MEQNPLRRLMKKRRSELGKMTQQEAAKLAGVNKATWNRWESEDQIPREETLPNIARTLGLQVEDLRREVLSQWRDIVGDATATLQLEKGDPEIPLPGYTFKNPELQAMSVLLELDFSSLGSDKLQLDLADWRSSLRAQLINADVSLQTLRAAVAIYRRFAYALLGLPVSLFRPAGRRGKVRRKLSGKSPKDGPKRE